MDPVSCVSCVSWWYWLYAVETHETFHQESGMRYQVSSRRDSEHESGLFVTAARRSGPLSGPDAPAPRGSCAP